MMLAVIRVDTIRCENDRPVALIGVNGGRANAGVRVNSRQNHGVGLEQGKLFVQTCAIKSTVALLDDDRLRWVSGQFWNHFGPRCSSDGDENPLSSHFEKCIPQVRLELLPHPYHRPRNRPHKAGKLVDRANQSVSSIRFPAIEKIPQHVDNKQHRPFHAHEIIMGATTMHLW